MNKKAKIIRFNEIMAVGFLVVEENGQEYPFRFNQIKNYRGEYVKELRKRGVREGSMVIADIQNDMIVSVHTAL